MDALVGWLRQEHPEYAHEFDLLRLCGGQLAGILRGEIDSRQLIFGGEAFQALSDFYHDSPTSRFYNEIMAGCVAGMTDDARDQLSVVEVGAGTGATTAALLPLVGGKIARYTFTDVSRFFLRRAEGRFGANAAMDFATLDIERDPRAQGFDALADVVVAANVVHATSDLRQTLTHMRGLLAPGGTLVLSEVTRRSAWLDLIFGVFDGWWRFADLDLRPDHPLLTAGSWRQVLHECGFDPGVTVADPDREGGTQASVIMAAKPADAEKRPRPAPGRRPVRRWIVLADRRGVGVLIAGRLTRLGDIVRVIHTPAHAWANAGMNGLAKEITQEAPDVGVIHAWSLDAPVGESVSSCELMDWQQTVCASALGLASVVSPVTQIAFVTSGAQAVPGDVSLPNVAQSPLWGLGRVMITENAGAVCRLIDIGAEPGEADVDAVVRELESGDGEQEIVIRGARRYVREVYRLGAATGENPQPVLARPGEGDSLGIAVRSPGALDSLELAEMPKTRPGPDEVAIRVMATGLNFRSVLLALGMLPGIAMGSDEVTRVLGTEYAGEVVAVGEDVKALQVGDEVVALASGALGSHAVARAKLALPKPPNLTWEEAASIPSAFMTAEYTLGRLAALAPGERVLIHSATGAVGLAALDVARRTGAEVFATAGSQEKRQLLQSMGIEHVMDSRSPGWAQDVLERTGGAGVDVILNSLGGEAIRKGLGILRPYGRFVEIGKRDIFQNAAVGLLPFRRNLSFFAFDLVGLGVERPDVAAALLRDVLDRSAAGEARPLPLTVFDLSESEQAFRLMAQARHVGKIVLTVNRAEYAVRASGQAPLFRADASYLIVGGLGGFGLKVAEWMANAGAGTLVLMTRSGMPKEDPAALRRLREGGTGVIVVTGDVSKQEDVGRVLDHIGKHCAPLKGVFHAAMVLDDDLLVRLDSARVAGVLAPKVAGAWNLHRLTAGLELDHFVLFSSATSLFGHQGQGSYSAANAFLDALAPYRRAAGRPCTTINWGAISGAGYVSRNADVGKYLAWSGLAGFGADEAVSALEIILRRDLTNVMAARVDWTMWAQRISGIAASKPFVRFAWRAGLRSEQRQEDGGFLAALQAAPDDEREELLEDLVVQRVAKVCASSPGKIDRDLPLTDMGFDSLMTVELQTALKRDFGTQLPIVDLLEGVSVRQLVSSLLDRLRPGTAAVRAASPSQPSRLGPDGACPLSFEQRRFWFLDRLYPGTPACNLYAAQRVAGEFDADALRQAMAEIARRHDVLRATFTMVDGDPVQVFGPSAPPHFQVIDLTDGAPTARPEQEALAARLLTGEVRQPFDLELGPLFRVVVLRLSERDHIFCFTVHHIAFDAGSATVLIAEGMSLYLAYAAGRRPPASGTPPSYSSYVQWQQTLESSSQQAAHLAYWRKQLAGIQPVQLPANRTPPARRTLDGGHIRFALPETTAARLADLSREAGATPFATLMTTFQILLSSYSGQDDITVGTPVVTRSAPGASSMIGCFMNTVVIRTDLSGNPTFAEALRRVRQVTAEALDHADVPFDEVVRAAAPTREGSATPLIQAMLVVHSTEAPQLDLPGLRFEPVDVESNTSLFDLLLLVEPGEQFRCSLEYSTDRFGRQTAEAVARRFGELVEAILDEPDAPISRLSSAGQDVRRVPREWEDTKTDFPGLRVDELFDRQALVSPDAPAVIHGGLTMTYGELQASSEAVAAHLSSLGVGPGTIVAVGMSPSVTVVAAALGIIKAGGALLPLDTQYPLERLSFILSDAKPVLVIADRSVAPGLAGHGVEVLAADCEWSASRPYGGGRDAVDIGPDTTAYVIYTSGSTGKPKGVLVPHGALSNQVQARQQAFPLSSSDRVLQRTPLAFDPSIWELFGPLCFGSALVIPPGGSQPADIAGLRPVLTRNRITALQVVPLVLKELLSQGVLAECESLRHVFCGGEVLTPALASAFFAQSSAELHNLYGPAETAIDATYWTCSRPATADVIPIGYPIANVQAHILDADGRRVPAGVVGELHIGGAGVALGYLGRPSLTAEKFIMSPPVAGSGPVARSRLYRTGDLARYRPDGAIEFVGRRDNQVKVRGVRVELEEVEAAITAVPAVRDVCCVAEEHGGASPVIVAYVAAEQTRGLVAQDIRDQLTHVLPAQMLPSAIVVADALPRLPNGKVNRRSLARLLTSRPSEARPKVAPRDAIERQLQEIWADCLARAGVSVTDNFFELGGHSLLAAHVVAQVQQSTGSEISLAAFFDTPTIEGLARLIRGTIGVLPSS